jgi:hypothetical protein
VVAAAFAVFGELRGLPGRIERLPSWDPAAHGMDGIMLADALRAFSPARFFHAIYLMSYWPPVFPLLEAPAFLLGGYEYHVARDLVSLLFAATIIAAYWAGTWLDDRVGVVIGLLAALLTATCFFFQLYAGMVMAEIPSALFFLTSVGTYLAYRRLGSARSLALHCLSLDLLFFTKYNNGVIFFIALGLYQAVTDATGRSALLRTLREYWRSRAWRRPYPLFVAVYLAFLAAIQLTGGWELELGGKRVFLKTVGNPVYILVVLTLLRWLVWRRDLGRAALGLYRRLGEPYRSFVKLVLLPIAVWMVNPNNLRTFFLVMVNEAPTEKTPLGEWLLFYPRVFVEHYVRQPWLAAAIVLAAAAPLLFWRRLAPAGRFLYVLLGLGTALCVCHQNQSPRYIFPLVPLLFLLAAAGVAWPLRRLAAAWRDRVVLVGVVAAGIAFAVVVRAFPTAALTTAFAGKATDPALAQVLGKICTDTAAGDSKATVLGFWDELNPSLVQWHCRKPPFNIPYDNLPVTPNRLGLDFYAPDFDAFLARDDIRTIFVATYRTDPPQEYLMHYRNAWLLPLIQRLPTDPRFEVASTFELEQPWYRLVTYRRKLSPD